MSFPELALSSVLIGQLNDNEYLTVDSATLLHCPVNDDEACCSNVEAHLCLAQGTLPPQRDVCFDQHQLSWSGTVAETLILQLSSILKQLSLGRLKTQPQPVSHLNSMYYCDIVICGPIAIADFCLCLYVCAPVCSHSVDRFSQKMAHR